NADAFNTTLIALIGACATDNCNGIGTVTSDYDFNNFVAACGNTGSITITFEVPDGCGNITTATATLTIEDTTDPTWTTAPANGSESCDGNGNATGFNAWLSSNAGAAADDVCGTTTITSDFISFVAGNCPGTGVYTYNFTATDECGNDISQTATFTIDDTANPTITCPADATINCGDPMDPSVTGTATATDVCDSDVAITYTDGAPVVNGCTQTITRTWTATDA